MGAKSLVLLGWNFLLHVLSRVFFLYRRGGIQKFRENFDGERLFPLTQEDRGLLASWQSCVACGLCEQVCPDLLSQVESGRGVGPQMIASGLHRELPSYGVSWPDAQNLAQCQGCNDCEAICPVEVPLRQLASFIVRVGQQS